MTNQTLDGLSAKAVGWQIPTWTSLLHTVKGNGTEPKNLKDRLGGLQVITADPSLTMLEGRLPDQAALKGVLDALYELRLCLPEVSSFTQHQSAEKNHPLIRD